MDCQSIVVIEDEHDIRVSIRNALEEEGYYVFSATNGKNGLELLRRIKPPGVILLDLMMPLSSGFDFLKEKNADPNLAAIPVVVMSASGNRMRLLPADKVDGFLHKPLELDTLLKTAQRYCGVAGKKNLVLG